MLSEDWSFFLQESLWNSFCYCVCCFIVHYGNYNLAPRLIPGFKKMSKDNQFGWTNRGSSITHACVMFGFATNYWVNHNPSMVIPAVLGQYEARMLDIMMGYLWYDACMEYAATASFDVLAHHAMGLASHMMSRLSGLGPMGFYSMMVYMAEGSTPFLHIGWLLYALKKTSTYTFTAISVVLLIMFFFLRIINAPYIVYHMYSHRDDEQWRGQVGLFWVNWFIVAAFAVLNYVWFYQLIRIALKPSVAQSISSSAPIPEDGSSKKAKSSQGKKKKSKASQLQ